MYEQSVLLLQAVILQVLLFSLGINGRLDMTVDSQLDCDHLLRRPLYKHNQIFINYYGDPLAEDCDIRISEDFKYDYICVVPEQVEINDCSVEVRIYEGSHSSFLPPDKLLDCKTSSSSNQEELCTNISLMDIVIRKSSSNGGGGKTNIRLRVYPKDSEPDKTSGSSNYIIVIGVIAAVCILIVGIAVAICQYRARRRAFNNMFPGGRPVVIPAVQYQTTQAYQPSPQGYQPTPTQGYQPPPQGYQPPQNFQPQQGHGYQLPPGQGNQPQPTQSYGPQFQAGYQPQPNAQDIHPEARPLTDPDPGTEKRFSDSPPPYPGK